MREIDLKKEDQDKREYVRLKSVFPVDFTIVRLHEVILGVEREHGHTANVSRSGLCLETDRLKESTIKYLAQEGVHLSLDIHIHFIGKTLKAVAEIVWAQQHVDNPSLFTIGLKFRKIAPADLKRLLSQAERARYWTPRNALIALCGIVAFVLLSFWLF